MQDHKDVKAAASPEATEPPAEGANGHHPSRILALARAHPTLTVIGAVGVGLFGGLELAAGVLLGAGVAAIARGRNGQRDAASTDAPHERTRRIMDRAPMIKERARAVMQAARGKIKARASGEASPVAP